MDMFALLDLQVHMTLSSQRQRTFVYANLTTQLVSKQTLGYISSM